MSSLKKALADETGELFHITNLLDGLSHESRVSEMKCLSGADMGKLWNLAHGKETKLEDMVPETVPPLVPVHHVGWNSLPLFRSFEKRFCRASVGEQAAIVGYNEGQTRGVVGPGYFVVRETAGDERGSVVIDYTLMPESTPEQWPKVQSNTRGVSNLVYAHMQDFIRGVSAHVTVGRAWRKNRISNNYFLLCREPS